MNDVIWSNIYVLVSITTKLQLHKRLQHLSTAIFRLFVPISKPQKMTKQLLTVLVALAICTTTFGQKSPFNRNQTIHKSKISVDRNGSTTGNAEVGEKCFQHSFTEMRMAQDPSYRQGVEDARQITEQITRELQSGVRTAPPVYTIPVVFHVIHKGEAIGSGTNISDAQIMSTIDALNRDYRRTSADGGIGQGAGPDTEIQFCLAGVDPSGNPHSGITRHNGTSVSGYSNSGITTANDEDVKALSNWDNRYYMNVWIVSEINGNGADLANPNQWTGGTLGYAYVPQGNVSFMSDYDGIVVVNLCVGNDPNNTQGFRIWPYSLLNRTLTHEAGHYLGLYHTFDDNSPNSCQDGDGFTDTPNAKQVSSASCSYPSACTNQMIENYMDYTNEDCQNQFTDDQTAYMRSILTGVRSDLVSTNNCSVSAANDYDAGISSVDYPSGSICESTFEPLVTLSNYGATTLTSVQINYYVDAQTPATYNWTGSLATNQSATVTLPSVTSTTGAHTFNANTSSPNGQTDQDNTNNASSASFTAGSADTYVTLLLYPDNYGSETTWTLTQDGGGQVANGGPYTNGNTELIEVEICVQSGECYEFIINDSESDGICCDYGTGTYSIADEYGFLIHSGGEFGGSETTNFCVPTLDADCGIAYDPFFANASGYSLSGASGDYVSGTNSYGDLAKAQAFSSPGTGYEISGFLAWIGAKENNGSSVTANLYALDGAGTNSAGAVNSAPGTVLATTTKAIAQIDTIGFFTRFNFANPVQVNANYAIGLDFSNMVTNADQLAIVSNVNGDANGSELAWEKWNTGAWYTMDASWSTTGDFDLALFPIICQSNVTGIDQQYGAELHLFPNPSNGSFAIVNPNMVDGQINIYNSVGQLIQSEATNGQPTINLNMLDKTPGVYFVKLDSPQTNWVQRIVVQ